MPTDETPDEAARRARLERAALLLGDLLPGTTRDETAEGWSDQGGRSGDGGLRRVVPPDHGKD